MGHPLGLICILFKLNRTWWFTRQIIEYPVDPTHFVYDSAHDGLQYGKWNFCTFCSHEVYCVDCTQCHCIVVGSLVTHNTYRTHVCECCEVLVRHPCRCFAVFLFVFCCRLVYFLPVDGIGILHDSDFIGTYFADDTDSKSRSWEWLTEYQMFWKSQFQSGFPHFVLE